MERTRLRALVGVSMVGLGLLQAGIYAVQSEWLPTGLGLVYSVIGIAYLWAEVYAVD